MEKKKIYIFFAGEIITIGGMQMYAAGKVKYLEELGWQVFVFFAGPSNKTSAILSLDKYVKIGGGCNFLWGLPPYRLKRYEQEQILNLLTQKVVNNIPGGGGGYSLKDCEIIVESFYDVAAYWGELFAEKIGARHFFSALNEIYRPDPNSTAGNLKTYQDNLDFFYFKWQRNEMICSEKSCTALFNGYKNITKPKYEMPQSTVEMYPIQDVENFPVEQIQRLDWNICHVGRVIKDYVSAVIKGVGELARRYPDKKINFIFVGNAEPRRELIIQTFSGVSNVLITNLGDMVPIPRKLFSRVDVVCGISQSARFCANDGVLTICGSAVEWNMTPGVLGYDTKQQVYGEGKFSYVEVLENVLVKKLYVGKKYKLEKLLPAEHYYKNFWTILKKADPKKEYFTERLQEERIRNWAAVFPFAAVARGARIIFYGATEVTKDYKAQILSNRDCPVEFGKDYVKQIKPAPYCEIVATVDENPDDFDNEVVGVERLKTLDYDAIILCVFPDKAQSAFEKIKNTVPQMENRIIYNLQAIQI